MSIRVGSQLRVLLPFRDRKEDGTEAPIHLGTVTSKRVVITKPDGTPVADPVLTVTFAPGGDAYWEGVVDAPGLWRAQGFIEDNSADEFISDPVSWRVYP